jgi:hypothetical protein
VTTATPQTRSLSIPQESGNNPTRVACYVRISTDEEHQPFSLDAQETRLGASVASPRRQDDQSSYFMDQ